LHLGYVMSFWIRPIDLFCCMPHGLWQGSLSTVDPARRHQTYTKQKQPLESARFVLCNYLKLCFFLTISGLVGESLLGGASTVRTSCTHCSSASPLQIMWPRTYGRFMWPQKWNLVFCFFEMSILLIIHAFLVSFLLGISQCLFYYSFSEN
jgi:hypothetical protein